MSDRKGGWCQTASGRAFWPLDPRAEDVSLEDIAHALSNLCRFNGHCREFYSVAQHCVLVSYRCAQLAEVEAADFDDLLHAQRAGLMHDAAEAYLVDLPRPVKQFLDGYRVAETNVERCIAERFGLTETFAKYAEIVKQADNELLATEARDLMAEPPMMWSPMPAPLPERISVWSPGVARETFLNRARLLSL